MTLRKCFVCGRTVNGYDKLWKHVAVDHQQSLWAEHHRHTWEQLSGSDAMLAHIHPCPVCGEIINSVVGTKRWGYVFMVHCQQDPERHAMVLALIGWL